MIVSDLLGSMELYDTVKNKVLQEVTITVGNSPNMFDNQECAGGPFFGINDATNIS